MNGFKNFILKGNLVDLAVAVIIATAFGLVVKTFTAWLTAQLPHSWSSVFTDKANSFGAFMNAVIAFVLLAAIVYFAVVLPYVTLKEKLFPSAPDGKPADIALLEEIRDLLAQRQS